MFVVVHKHVIEMLTGEIHLQITGECLYIGITIKHCPSTKPYLGGQTNCTPGECTCMHVVKKEGD